MSKVSLAASGLMTHYRQSTATVATCWKVTLRPGTAQEAVLGFTSLDSDILLDGVIYAASTGLTPAAVETQTKMAVDNTNTAGILDSDVIKIEDLTAGVWDYATVQVFIVNWANPASGTDIILTGHLGEVQVTANGFNVELRGLAAAYQHLVGEMYKVTCAATLGDARCGVDLGGSSGGHAFSNTGTVQSVSADGLVIFDTARTEPGPTGGTAITAITKALPPVVSAAAHGFAPGQIVYISGVLGMLELNGMHFVVKTAPTAGTFTLAGVDSTNYGTYTSGGTVSPVGDTGFFDYGKMTMTSGASTGLSVEVKAYSPGTITLQLQFALGIAPGDTYEIVAGCGKRFEEDCVARFANGERFRGFPHLPGMDKVLRVGGQE